MFNPSKYGLKYEIDYNERQPAGTAANGPQRPETDVPATNPPRPSAMYTVAEFPQKLVGSIATVARISSANAAM